MGWWGTKPWQDNDQVADDWGEVSRAANKVLRRQLKDRFDEYATVGLCVRMIKADMHVDVDLIDRCQAIVDELEGDEKFWDWRSGNQSKAEVQREAKRNFAEVKRTLKKYMEDR